MSKASATSHTPAGCRAEKNRVIPVSRQIVTLRHSKGDLANQIQNFLTGEVERQNAFGFHKPIHGFITHGLSPDRPLHKGGLYEN